MPAFDLKSVDAPIRRSDNAAKVICGVGFASDKNGPAQFLRNEAKEEICPYVLSKLRAFSTSPVNVTVLGCASLAGFDLCTIDSAA